MLKLLRVLSIKKDILESKIKNKAIPQCTGGGVCKSVGGGGC